MRKRTGSAPSKTQARRAASPGGREREAAQTSSPGATPADGRAAYRVRLERYLELARQAERAGDKVLSESYYQHAEHFYRLSRGEAA
jgi:hypothetical protein